MHIALCGTTQIELYLTQVNQVDISSLLLIAFSYKPSITHIHLLDPFTQIHKHNYLWCEKIQLKAWLIKNYDNTTWALQIELDLYCNFVLFTKVKTKIKIEETPLKKPYQ